jgi:Cu/Ag efflux pump CusA
MLGDLMSSVEPIEIKVFGDDQQNCNSYPNKIAAVVTNVKGTADVFDGIVIAGPSVNIAPNYSRTGAIWLTLPTCKRRRKRFGG